MKCDRLEASGAPCPDDAGWRPVLLVYPPFGDQHVRLELELAVCERHRDATALDTFLSDAGWEQIVSAIEAAGGVAPDRDRVEVAFTPIQ